jgi:hypothetical protein
MMKSNKSGSATIFGLRWLLLLLGLLASCARFAAGFTAVVPYPTPRIDNTKATMLLARQTHHEPTTAVTQGVKETSSPLRRWILGTLVATAATTGVTETARAADTTGQAEVRGTPVTPFNSLMFQYRGNTWTFAASSRRAT